MVLKLTEITGSKQLSLTVMRYGCVFLLQFCPFRSVTPQTILEFRVWSHHTLKADALLGRATIDLKQALLMHNRN